MPPSSSKMMPSLPAGFRFHPTDEELIVHYLMKQAASIPCPVPIIAEVNIYHCNPWDLPPKALFGENEWYFFSPRDRKYPNGARPNRAAGSGYWKATGTDKAIVSSAAAESVGVKKALVFYRGKPPRGVKTDWVMHEYRLTATVGGNNINKQNAVANNIKRSRSAGGSSSSSMRLDDWVLCRIHKKSNNFQFASSDHEQEQDGSSTLEEEEEDTSLNNSNTTNSKLSPKSEEATAGHHVTDEHNHQFFPPPPNSSMGMGMSKSCSLTDLLNTIDYSTLSELLLDAPPPLETNETPTPTEPPPPQHQISTMIHGTAPPVLNNNVNNNNNTSTTINNMLQQGGDDDALLCYNNNSLKRKRIMTTADHGAASSFFGDGTSTSLKKKLMPLPSDDASARSSSSFFFGGFCNPQLSETGTGSTGINSFQYSGLVPNYNPFLIKNEALLLHNHLEMQ